MRFADDYTDIRGHLRDHMATLARDALDKKSREIASGAYPLSEKLRQCAGP